MLEVVGVEAMGPSEGEEDMVGGGKRLAPWAIEQLRDNSASQSGLEKVEGVLRRINRN